MEAIYVRKHDFDAHIRAVEEDLEYYRAKRFEPRIFYLLRRGVVTFADLLKARVALKRKNQFFKTRKPQGKNIEARVRYLEEWLDEYVKGIVLVSARAVEAMDMVTEDNRKERGDLPGGSWSSVGSSSTRSGRGRAA